MVHVDVDGTVAGALALLVCPNDECPAADTEPCETCNGLGAVHKRTGQPTAFDDRDGNLCPDCAGALYIVVGRAAWDGGRLAPSRVDPPEAARPSCPTCGTDGVDDDDERVTG